MTTNPEKHSSTTPEGEKVYRTERPNMAEWKLKVQEHRDALVAQALGRGASYDDLKKIEQITDEEILEKMGVKLFPTQSVSETKEKAI